jgi:hypothetical protein
MILTLTIPTEDYARAMSAALWSLARPSRGDADTAYAVGWATHPTTGDVALSIPETYAQRVDADADVAAFVAAMPIPEGERTALAAILEAARGGAPLTVADWLPPTLAAQALTDAEAGVAGWFQETPL